MSQRIVTEPTERLGRCWLCVHGSLGAWLVVREVVRPVRCFTSERELSG